LADAEVAGAGKGWFQRARAIVGKQLAQQQAEQATANSPEPVD
jgi:hypothetical protein